MGLGGGGLPEKCGDACDDDTPVDYRGEADGVLVAEGEHALMIGGVLDIGVGWEC